MRKFGIGVIAACVALSLSAPAAMAKPGGKGKHFEKMDTNGDGVVSREEFDAKHDEMFSKMDANGDGNVTKEEMKAAHKARMEEHKKKRAEHMKKHFGEMDKDKDGSLVFDEMKDHKGQAYFDKLDADSDGKVTWSEFEEGHKGKHRRYRCKH